jgi:NAD(P)-dependent dehydrogenase (short-subunit alcohol dehydrogenase family)
MSEASTQRVALITGANKGLGFETARQLGQQSVFVLLGSRDRERGEKAADQLRQEGIAARAVQLDVTAPETIARAAEEIGREFGKLDVLINNAGVNLQRAAPSELSIENVRKTFDTNYFGPLAVTQAFLPLLKKSPAARIVNVSTRLSSLFHLTDPQWEYARNGAMSMAYASSKTALNVLTVAFANELKGTAIKVNAVEPGYTATDFNNFKGTKKPQDSVKVIVKYATLPPEGPTGGFFDESGRVAW